MRRISREREEGGLLRRLLWPAGRASLIALSVALVAACSSAGQPSASPRPISLESPPTRTWPHSFETYLCSTLSELNDLSDVLDERMDDLEAGGLIDPPDWRELDDSLERAEGYLDQVPAWEDGQRVHDLTRAAVRHFRDGLALVRPGTSPAPQAPADSPVPSSVPPGVGAAEAFERGISSLRKTDTTLRDLEGATGFAC